MRILAELRLPDRPVQDLLDTLSVTRADGRRFSLGEFPIASALRTGETIRAEEIVLAMPDGSQVTTLVNSTPIYSEQGEEVESVVVTLQDISAPGDLERLRVEFLAMVSHELRTPLAAIKGSAATLLEASPELDDAEVQQFHRVISAQADRMRELISDLLDVAHIASGTLSVNPEPSNLITLVDHARSAFLSGAGSRDLEIDVPRGLPLVMADRRRVVQVVSNLLVNAARHSRESGSIRLTAVEEGLHVAVSVIDQGRGIAPERLPHLFSKVSRTERDHEGRETESNGLGLAICKGIVEAHGGRISAESEGHGLGARFTFTLPTVGEPLREATHEITRAAAQSQQAIDDRVRILAVDDDPVALRHIREVLSDAGYEPIVTADPDEALLLTKERRPDLALLDLVLPDMDGIELMQDILDVTDVPVIFVSAYGRDENIERAFDMGASDYVVKPFSATELMARITAALRRRAAFGGTESPLPYQLGDLTVDFGQRSVHVAGHAVHLTPIEFALLRALSANAGSVMTHPQLLRRVWGPRNSGDPQLVRTHMRRLRRKLGDDADNPKYIFTEPRVGYRMPEGEGRRPA